MQNNHDDQVIYLKDLLFSVLYRWKHILIFGLILAVLLGGLKGVSTYRSAQVGETGSEAPITEDVEKDSQQSKLEILQASYAYQEAYLQESILMQIDPYDFYRASLSVYVSNDYQIMPGMDYQTPDLSNVILSSYVSRITSENYMKDLATKLGTTSSHIKELLNISTDSNTRMLSITISHPLQEGAQALMDDLVLHLEQKQPEIAQTVQAHQIHIYQQDAYEAKDPALADIQAQNIQRLLDLQVSIDELKASVDAPADMLIQVNTPSVLKSTVIFGIIGFVLGAFVVVAVIFVNHIASNKVYSARTLSNRTHVKILGAMNTIEKMDSITRALRRLDNRSLVEGEQQAKLIAANIQNLCADAKHLLITGSAESAVLSDALKQAMPNVQIDLCGSLLRDVSAVHALSNCDRVLLVEKCGVSHYSDILQTMSVIADNEKTLLGCVLLNG